MAQYPPYNRPPPSLDNNVSKSNAARGPSISNIKQVEYAEVPPPPAIHYARSDERYVGARFIMECGRKLNVEAITTATAIHLFHNFFQGISQKDYDQYLIASACLYLAGKLEENDQLKIRDLMNVVHTTLHQTSEPMSLDSEYYNMRDAICHAELLVLRMVGFKTKFDHPHKYILHHLKSLKDWVSEEVWKKYPIARTSWSILQDCYHDHRILNHDGSHISIACISIALQTYGIQVPYISESQQKSWTDALSSSLTKEKLWDLMTLIMEVYNNNEVFITPLLDESKVK